MNTFGSKHLSLEDRTFIQTALANSFSCKRIATLLNKDPRTISKEILHRRVPKPNGRFKLFNSNNFVCNKVNKFPFVCDNCPKIHSCNNQFHFLYSAKAAHNNYLLILSNSRAGINCSQQDFNNMDAILLNGVANGQSIRHIINSNKDSIPYSTSSIYRLIDKQLTSVKNIDLIRKVKFKRRQSHTKIQDNKLIRNGRTYSDFLNFINSNHCINIVQLDTVEALKSKGKCLITIHFVFLHFMLAFIIDSKAQINVSRVFKHLQAILGDSLYKKMFPVILTDRGTEFSDPLSIECNQTTGEVLTKLFYCNSYSSYQKGALEENHTLLRYILPKGTSFKDLTQEKVNTIVSHINSYYRHSIDCTPFALAKDYFGQDVLDLLHIKEIPQNKVCLKPNLIK